MRFPVRISAVLVLAACAAPPATPEQRQAAEARLLAPFLVATEVGCSELVIELTGNFHGNVGQPAIDVKAHAARKERGADWIDTVWTNQLGDPSTAFVVTVGQPDQITDQGVVRGPRTQFTVVNQVRLRVYEGTHPLTLNARAGGAFAIVREASVQKPRDVTEFVVENGERRIR